MEPVITETEGTTPVTIMTTGTAPANLYDGAPSSRDSEYEYECENETDCEGADGASPHGNENDVPPPLPVMTIGNHQHEGRPCYMVELNSYLQCGMTHQLWGIANLLVIAHFTGRDACYAGFHPDYDSHHSVPVSDVLDVPACNAALPGIGATSRIVDPPPGPAARWTPAAHPDPMGKCEGERLRWIGAEADRRMPLMISALRDGDPLGTAPLVDLGSSFVYPLDHFYRGLPQLHRMVLGVLAALRPGGAVAAEVERVRRAVGILPGERYLAAHARLEDDWVAHRTRNYHLSPHLGRPAADWSEEVFVALERGIRSLLGSASHSPPPADPSSDPPHGRGRCCGARVFVATGLEKYPNANNAMMERLRSAFPPGTIVSSPARARWEDSFPGVRPGGGRELQAMVDYTLCTGADGFVACANSSFSINVALAMRHEGKPVVQVDD